MSIKSACQQFLAAMQEMKEAAENLRNERSIFVSGRPSDDYIEQDPEFIDLTDNFKEILQKPLVTMIKNICPTLGKNIKEKGKVIEIEGTLEIIDLTKKTG
jgi:hypothetical protein